MWLEVLAVQSNNYVIALLFSTAWEKPRNQPKTDWSGHSSLPPWARGAPEPRLDKGEAETKGGRKKVRETTSSLTDFPRACGTREKDIWMVTTCSIFTGLDKKYGKNWNKIEENACLDHCSQALPLSHLRQARKMVGQKRKLPKQGMEWQWCSDERGHESHTV